jgi:hypothetical protein
MNESQTGLLYNMHAIVEDNDFWTWSEKVNMCNLQIIMNNREIQKHKQNSRFPGPFRTVGPR